jgi:hypothetical protein
LAIIKCIKIVGEVNAPDGSQIGWNMLCNTRVKEIHTTWNNLEFRKFEFYNF